MNTSEAIEILRKLSNQRFGTEDDTQLAIEHAVQVMLEHNATQEVAQMLFQQNSYMRSRLHDRCISVDGPVMMQVDWRVGNENH